MRYDPKRHRLPPFTISGILPVDKPAGWTSFDVVNCLRWHFNIPKLGHCGTLDPAATGLLVLVAGDFTRLSGRFTGEDKVYEGTLLLGQETDSGDLDGQVTAQHDASGVTEEMLSSVMASFVGPQLQTPPMVSAVKKDGQKLCDLARKGIEVEREPREIRIDSLEIRQIRLPECDFELHCSKGTYVRTLCMDIGTKLGVGGVLKCLRRLRSGVFDVADAYSLDALKAMEQADLALAMRNYLLDKLAGGKELLK